MYWTEILKILKGHHPDCNNFEAFKSEFSGLSQFLEIESHLEIMENAFYFTWKDIFVFKVFKFLSWLFGHIEKRLD